MRLCILAIALTLTGCTDYKGEMKEEVSNGGKEVITPEKYITPGNKITYVFPVTVDGVRCMVATANSGGRSITCDWRKHD